MRKVPTAGKALVFISLLVIQSSYVGDLHKKTSDVSSENLDVGSSYPTASGFSDGGSGETKFSAHESGVCWIEAISNDLLCASKSQLVEIHDNVDNREDLVLDLPENIGLPRQLSASENYICIIDHRARVFCSQSVERTQNSENTFAMSNFHEIILGEAPILSIKTGKTSSCALTNHGSVSCWENNLAEPSQNKPISVLDGYSSRAISISQGSEKFCAINVERDVFCWKETGSDFFQAFTSANSLPFDAVEIAIGEDYICALNLKLNLSCEGNIQSVVQYSFHTGLNYASINTSEFSPVVISSAKDYLCLVNVNGTMICIGGNLPSLPESPIYPASSISSDVSCFVPKKNTRLTCNLSILGQNISVILGRVSLSSIDSDDDGVMDHFDDFPNDKNRSRLCSKGFFGNHTCFPSPPGSFVNVSGSTEFFLCVPGTYQNNFGSVGCIVSPPGSYNSDFGSFNPEYCIPGTFSKLEGSKENSCIPTSPGNWSIGGALSQSMCPVGQFQPLSGQGGCLHSSPGHFVGSLGNSFQEECDIGYFQINSNSEMCDLSEPGYFVEYKGAVMQTPCPPGTYNPYSGSTSIDSCIPSPPGTYVQFNGSSNFQLCPPGTYLPSESGESLADCIQSERGYFSLEGASTQVPCPPGQYQPESGQETCLVADLGHYVPESGSGEQILCPPGTFQYNSSESFCFESVPGTYVNLSDPIASHVCPEGSFQPNYRQIECALSSPGYYVNISNPTTEIPCEYGFYQPNYSSSSCISSLPGQFVPSTASTTFEYCEPGTYQDQFSANQCLLAAIGHYSEEMGSEAQIPCPIGHFQNKSGATSCISAEPGNYVDSISSPVQYPCQLGYFQESYGQESCIPSPEGYYVDEFGALSPTRCPDGGTNLGTGNADFWSCMNSDHDNDGIADEIDAYPFMAMNSSPVIFVIYWVPISALIAYWLNARHSGPDGENGGGT